MTTISPKKSTKSKLPPPSTILTITLNPDGTGTLLTKRGELACVNSFTYHDLKGILNAIQQGAARLVEVEQNPPPALFEASPVPATTSVTDVDTTAGDDEGAETASADNPADSEAQDASSETPTSAVLATEGDPLIRVAPPVNSIQMSLL
ncbi:MAG: hypothetical protein ABI947_19270 [Chloroflexota bacterium]